MEQSREELGIFEESKVDEELVVAVDLIWKWGATKPIKRRRVAETKFEGRRTLTH